jgi:hypothetical protein
MLEFGSMSKGDNYLFKPDDRICLPVYHGWHMIEEAQLARDHTVFQISATGGKNTQTVAYFYSPKSRSMQSGRHIYSFLTFC